MFTIDDNKPAALSLAPLEEEDDSKRLWVVVKSTVVEGRANEYRLNPQRPGETFKIGRVKFRVREISCKGASNLEDNNTDYNSD
jgi:hypothetical protein